MPEVVGATAAQAEALTHWFRDLRQLTVEARAGQGGLSGAHISKVLVDHCTYCLRRWPRGETTRRRLAEIHEFQSHLSRQFSDLIPAPIATDVGKTIVEAGGYRWELAPWLPGAACPDAVCEPDQFAAALLLLGQLHKAAQSFSCGDHLPVRPAASPGLQKRAAALRELAAGRLHRLELALRADVHQSLLELARRLHKRLSSALPIAAAAVEPMARAELELQWRLGDIHREHVLFTGRKVTGVVDFGAACIDSAVGDVARLAGSLVGDHQQSWHAGLATYEQVRPLSTLQRQAIVAFDAGGVVGASANWLTWLFVERREHWPMPLVEARLTHLADRLEAMIHRGTASVLE